MKNKAKILIQVKDVGFTFLLDKRMKHNLISPTFLAFFKTDKQRDLLWNNDIEAVSTKSEYNSSLPFLPSYVIVFHWKIHSIMLGRKLFGAVIISLESVRQSNSILNMRDILTLNYSLLIRVLKRTMLF